MRQRKIIAEVQKEKSKDQVIYSSGFN